MHATTGKHVNDPRVAVGHALVYMHPPHILLASKHDHRGVSRDATSAVDLLNVWLPQSDTTKQHYGSWKGGGLSPSIFSVFDLPLSQI